MIWVVVGVVGAVRLDEQLFVAARLLDEGLVALGCTSVGFHQVDDDLGVGLPGARELTELVQPAVLASLCFHATGVDDRERLRLLLERNAAEAGRERLEPASQQDHPVGDDQCSQLDLELGLQLAQWLVCLAELLVQLGLLGLVVELELGALTSDVEVLPKSLTDLLSQCSACVVRGFGRVGHDSSPTFCSGTKLYYSIELNSCLLLPLLYTISMPRLHTYAQHFLRSPRLVAELIGHSNIRKNDKVYDLGAGSGVIASVLANKCKKVIAVENEPEALKKLRTNLGNILNVEIVEQDILKLRIPEGRYKIFSNIPFSESAAIVRKFTEADNPPITMYLIAQRQFARKLVPSDQHFTAQLGAQLAPRFTARIRKPLRRTDFTPPPGVDTVLLEIKLRDEPLLPIGELAVYREFIARCFAEQKFYSRTNKGKAGISSEKVPSQLSVIEWLALYNVSR